MLNLQEITCGHCGIMFGLPFKFYTERQENGGTFYCPNGHPRVFKETTEDKLRKELEKKQDQLEYQREAKEKVYANQDHLKRRIASLKGHITRLKNK